VPLCGETGAERRLQTRTLMDESPRYNTQRIKPAVPRLAGVPRQPLSDRSAAQPPARALPYDRHRRPVPAGATGLTRPDPTPPFPSLLLRDFVAVDIARVILLRDRPTHAEQRRYLLRER